jgi:anthranilate synthase component 2
MKILLLDNYDSFTYNLAHYLEPLASEIVVIRNDVFEIDSAKDFDRIVFSPGPGLPKDAGCMPTLIAEYYQTIPMLGICLGMQAIAACFGGKLRNLEHVLHGVQSECKVLQKSAPLFADMPASFLVGHYHSWVVEENAFPEELEITSKNQYGHIMSISHRNAPLCGVQFHPESVLTPYGQQIIKNWIKQ